jgi:glutamate synthase (ferredoxin)
VLGQCRNRKKAFRPDSVVNISGMSFGSLSGNAVEALNEGAHLSGCLHNTGEGAISPYHRHGGELIWQIGTGYFGCRDERGNFDESRFVDALAVNPVREIKLSQGAKPGLGGMLPAAKITPEIAEIRGIPLGQDCASPSTHKAFSNLDSMLDFVEHLAEVTGVPVGIKSAVGESRFWQDLVRLINTTGRSIDFVTIDGGEGGTGAAPLTFSDTVSLPFKLGFARVYRTFVEADLHEKILFVGSGKLGFPETALFAMGLGCDMIHVAREAMLAIGCIQAQRCHTGHCPTGVATQNKWLMSGLDPSYKAARVANYITTLRKEILQLSRACGYPHPALVPIDSFELIDDRFSANTIADCFAYHPQWGLPSPEDQQMICTLMAD